MPKLEEEYDAGAFKAPGETAQKATARVGEERFQKYDAKLKEQEVSHNLKHAWTVIMLYPYRQLNMIQLHM